MEKRTARLIALILLATVVVIAVIVARYQRTERPAAVVTASAIPLSPHRVHSLFATEDAVYAFNYNQQLLEKYSGTGTEASSQLLQGVERVVWSPDASQAILRVTNDLTISEDAIRTTPLLRPNSPDGAFLAWLWNAADRSTSFISDKYGFVSWTPDGSKIVYTFFPEQGQQEIAVADPSGQEWQTITRLTGLVAHEILFSDGQSVLFLGGNDEEADGVYQLTGGRIAKVAAATDAVADRSGQKILAWQTRGDEVTVTRIDLAAGKSSPVRLGTVPSTATWTNTGELILGGTDDEGGHLWRYSSGGDLVQRIDIGAIATILNLVSDPTASTLYFTSADMLYRVDLP